jgi:alcohol-forming fatty acyl-CoA reductase
MYKNELKLYHCGTSHRNPCYWGRGQKMALRIMSKMPMEKRYSEPKYDLIKNPYLYKLFFMKREIPANFFWYFSQMTGNPSMKKNAERMMKVIDMCKQRHVVFVKTVLGEWIFEYYNSYQLSQKLTKLDNELFQLDVIKIDWLEYGKVYIYGMCKYLLKQEMENPTTGRENFIRVSETPKIM